MVKKCIYCSCNIESDSVVDMCRPCMVGVWGEKMADAIVSGMENEKAKGNLEIGNTESADELKKGLEEDLSETSGTTVEN